MAGLTLGAVRSWTASRKSASGSGSKAAWPPATSGENPGTVRRKDGPFRPIAIRVVYDDGEQGTVVVVWMAVMG